MTTKWIKCSERMPENLKKVLIFVDYEIYVATYYEHPYLNGRGNFIVIELGCGWENTSLEFEEYEVSYWMPLPNPPESEE